MFRLWVRLNLVVLVVVERGEQTLSEALGYVFLIFGLALPRPDNAARMGLRKDIAGLCINARCG